MGLGDLQNVGTSPHGRLQREAGKTSPKENTGKTLGGK